MNDEIQPKQKPVNKVAQAFKIGIPVILIAGFLWTCSSCFNHGTSTNSTTKTTSYKAPATTIEQPLLGLMDFNDNDSNETSYIVKGQVKNMNSYKLDSVMAVVSVYDKDGKFINYGDSFIDYNPVMPYQISPFDVYIDYNPLIAKYNVSFKFFGGGTIEVKKI